METERLQEFCSIDGQVRGLHINLAMYTHSPKPLDQSHTHLAYYYGGMC
jgi:hypothetical protein